MNRRCKFKRMIIGAGASAHAGYPLCCNLWSHLTTFAQTDYADGEIGDAVRALQSTYGEVADVELALTALDRGDGAFQNMPDDTRLQIIRRIRRAIHEMWKHIGSGRGPRTRYDRLSSVVERGDILITFNYDLALDSSVAEKNLFIAPYGYCFPDIDESRSPIRVLKPHGSVTWSAEDCAGVPDDVAGYIFRTLGEPLVDNRDGVP